MDPERAFSSPSAVLVRSRPLALLAGSLLSAFVLTGCEEGSTQLEERINQLHSELEKTQGELQDAKRALANAKDELEQAKNSSKPASDSGGGVIDKTKLEESYMASAKDMRKELESKLKGFVIETCTLHNVRMPENVQPYNSDISLALRSTSGNRPYRVTLPVKADFTGKWIFPSADEIVARVEASKNGIVAENQTSAPGSVTNTSFGAQPAPVMESNGTVVVQWPGANNSTTASAPAPAPAPSYDPAPRTAPAPAPSSNNPSSPAQVMPVNKDVLIKF